MKQPGFPLRHAGGDYLLVEGGYNDDTRTLALLVSPENPAFTHPESAQRIQWCDQGEWFPVAQRAVGFVTFQVPDYEEQSPLVEEILERFVEERAEQPAVAWALQGAGGFAGTLEDILPMGLAVKVFDGEEDAISVGGEDRLVSITDLPRFLTQLSREGYAGAMWNERQPIFFCIDEEQEVQFLRVKRVGASKMGMDILEPNGEWEPYEGAEEIEFLENREACDQRLVATVGNQPVLDWPEDDTLWSVGPADGVPGKITNEENELSYGVLFSLEESARSWTEDMEEGWVSFPVPDVGDFLHHQELEGCGGLLNPGGHRVCNGVLWFDGDHVVLDSYSGFWTLDDGEFEPLE